MKFKFNNWICKYAPFLGRPNGMVLYPFVLFKEEPDNVPLRTVKHEMMHVYQVRNIGFFKFYIKYLWYQLRYGYRNNPYEIEARKYAEQPLTDDEAALFEKERNRYYKEK